MGWWNSDKYCNVTERVDKSSTNYLHLTHLEIHNIAWMGAGICTVLACILSVYLIYKHCRNYTCPSQQKYIVRILLMVPVYAIDSFLSFRFYWLSVYFDVIRDCYEAFVIYTFYSLLIEYVGGYKEGKELFSKKGRFKLALPLCCITVEPKRGLLRQCKRLTLQYVIIRPAMTVLAIVTYSLDNYCPGNFAITHAYLYVSFVNFVSVTVAMYALVLFYSVSRDHIAKFKPIPKFLSVKFVIFLSFWQALVVAGFVAIHAIKATTFWSTENIATGVDNTLLCAEMLIAAIWHISAFSYRDFEKEEKTSVLVSAADCFNPYDIAQDIYFSFFPKNNPKVELPTLAKDSKMSRDSKALRDSKVTRNSKYADITIEQEFTEEPEKPAKSASDVAGSVEHYVDVPLDLNNTPATRKRDDKYVDLSYKSDGSDDDSISMTD